MTRARRLALLLAACAALPGCSTVRGWFGGAPEDPPAATAVPAPPATARRDPAPPRSPREDAVRQEIRQIEADAKAGKVSVKEARRRTDELKSELEAVVKADARARARPAEAPPLAQRVADLDARLAAIEARLAEIERRLGATSR